MESPLNVSSPPPTTTSPKTLSMGSSTMASSQAAPTTTFTQVAIQSSLPKAVEPAMPMLAQPQPDLTSRLVSPAPQPTPTPAPEVKKALAPTADVQSLVSTSVVTLKAPSNKSIFPHAASKQHINGNDTTVHNTSSTLPSGSLPSHYGDTYHLPVLSRPFMYIIVGGIALVLFLAGLTVWSCVQKRRRRRSRKLSFSLSQVSEKEWGTTREMAGGMESVYRHSTITYDPNARSKFFHEDFDLGPMSPCQPPTTDYRSAKEWGGSKYKMQANQLMPMTERAPGFVHYSPQYLSSLPRALISGTYAGRQPTVPVFRPYDPSSGRLIVPPVSSVKMSPAEASNELQKIVERSMDGLFDHSDSFDSLSGLDDTPIHSNPEHFPNLMGKFPAARKLSSSFLPGADKSPPKDFTPLPLPRYNFKQTSL